MVRFREKGGLDDVRKCFRIERKRIKNAGFDELDKIARNAKANLSDMINEHNSKMNTNFIREFLNRNIVDIGLHIGITLLTINAPLLVGIVGGLTSFGIGSKSILDFVTEYKESKMEMEYLKERPIGILAKYFH